MCACNGSIGPVTVCEDVVVKVRLAVTDGVRRRFVTVAVGVGVAVSVGVPFCEDCIATANNNTKLVNK